jgi:hypothetical protein
MFSELGYYICDGKIFETKLKAMMYANDKKLPIKWHFNDKEFDSYNWAIEPEQSLDSLYDARARQIREQFDYVILSYSGGSDTNNILESFLRQNLLIDEVVTSWALDVTSKFIVCNENVKDPWNNNAEFYLHTRHRLEYIKLKSPRTKITVLDSSKSILDGLLDNDNATWVETKNDVFNVTGAFQYNPLYFSNIRKSFDSLKKVAYIIGAEKPKLVLIDDKLYMFFNDKSASLIPLRENVVEYTNIRPVLFYWSPDSCAMLAKQAHTVLKYIRTNESAKQIWRSRDFRVARRIQEELLKTIIYTTWNPNWFQVKKSISDWNCELDYWFTRGLKQSKQYSIWTDGLQNLIPHISNFLIYENGIAKGTIAYHSNYHYIGSL